MTTTKTAIGMNDKNGTPICYGDIVKFDFSTLMDTMFSNSNFGKVIKKFSLEKCVIHFTDARVFQPDYGWYQTLCYVAYFIKDGELFTSNKEHSLDKNIPYVSTPDEDPYLFFGLDPYFLIYLTKKNQFEVVGHSEEQFLSFETVNTI